MNENQTGFRKGYTTTDNCFLLKAIIDLFNTTNKSLFCAFIDYEKAFDNLWRSALWSKLLKSGIENNCKLFNVVKGLYNTVKSCVMVNNIKSEYFISKMGVRQGENLSPLLFSLYINDLEEFLVLDGNESLKFDIDMCDVYLKMFVLMYADDTVILARSEQGLQRQLNSLEKYCNLWKLKVNIEKTKILIFGKRRVKKDKYNFTYSNKSLEIVDTFKYLGVK